MAARAFRVLHRGAWSTRPDHGRVAYMYYDKYSSPLHVWVCVVGVGRHTCGVDVMLPVPFATSNDLRFTRFGWSPFQRFAWVAWMRQVDDVLARLLVRSPETAWSPRPCMADWCDDFVGKKGNFAPNRDSIGSSHHSLLSSHQSDGLESKGIQYHLQAVQFLFLSSRGLCGCSNSHDEMDGSIYDRKRISPISVQYVTLPSMVWAMTLFH